MIPVGHFGQPFAEEIVRDMTIVARGVTVVAGLLPAVELFAHDVAVHACTRVIGKIAGSLRIIKGISTRSREHADENGKQKFQCGAPLFNRKSRKDFYSPSVSTK
jgi:hypothetical protein